MNRLPVSSFKSVCVVFMFWAVSLGAQGQTTVIDDTFADGNLGTNNGGTGGGFSSLGQVAVTESAGAVNLGTAGDGSYSTMVAQSNTGLNPFAATNTMGIWRFGSVAFDGSWRRFWVGYRPAGTGNDHFYPDTGVQGLYVSILSNTGSEDNYTAYGNLVAHNGSTRTILASWNWSSISAGALDNLVVTLNTTSTTYSLAFSGATATPVLVSGAFSGSLTGIGTLGGNFVPGVHNQFGGTVTGGRALLDSILVQTNTSASPLAPTVTTPTSASITTSSASLGGNVTSDGGAEVTERGVVYAATATNNSPQIGGGGVTKVTTSGTTGVFTVSVTGLAAGTGYSFKAYAINSQGTSYSSTGTFSTSAPSLPEISVYTGSGTSGEERTDNSGTWDAGNVVANATGVPQVFTLKNTGTANLTGIGVSLGGAGSSQFSLNTTGLSSSLAPNATTTFSVTFSPTSTGTKNAVINIASNDADEGTFRIQTRGNGASGYLINDDFDNGNLATNPNGTGTGFSSYGTVAVTESGGAARLAGGAPTFPTRVISSNDTLSPFSANSTTAIFRFGTVEYTSAWQRLWCGYRISSSTANHFYPNFPGDQGLYVSVIMNTPGSDNYTYQGNLVSNNGTTPTILASWSWSDANQLSNLVVALTTTDTTYSLNFSGAAATPTFTYGAASGSLAGLGSVTGKTFRIGAHNQTELSNSTLVDAIQVCAMGVATAPAITSPTSASVTGSTAILGGNVTSDGGDTITERGVVYSRTTTNSDPAIGGNGVTRVTATGTTGIFTASVSGLSVNTGYTFKAYATNGVGTSYTNAATFTTPAPEIDVYAGVGTGGAALSDNSGTTNFGTVAAAAHSGAKSFTIQNTGVADLAISGITVSGAGAGQFSVDATAVPASLTSNAVATFTVTFNPDTAGIKDAVIQIASDDANENPFRINVTGTGAVLPKAAIYDGLGISAVARTDNAGVFAFGSVAIGNSATQTFTVQNKGNVDLTIASVDVTGAGSSRFTANTSALPTTLAGGQAGSFTVTFSPDAAQTFAAVIEVVTNDNDSPFHIPVEGAGAAGAVPSVFNGLSNAAADRRTSGVGTVNFGAIATGSSGPFALFTLKNTGNAPLVVNSIAKIGAQAADFSVNDLAAPFTLAAGAQKTFSIGASPTGTGARDGVIRLLTNATAPLDNFDIPVSAQGNGPEIAVFDGATTAAPSELVSDSTTVSFGAGSKYESLTHVFTIQNQGTATLKNLAVSLPGTTASQASVIIQPATSLNAGATTTFTVRYYLPGTYGARNATIAITSNDGDESPFRIPMTAMCTNTYRLTWTGTVGTYAPLVSGINVGSTMTASVDYQAADFGAGILSGATRQYTAPLSLTMRHSFSSSGYVKTPVLRWDLADGPPDQSIVRTTAAALMLQGSDATGAAFAGVPAESFDAANRFQPAAAAQMTWTGSVPASGSNVPITNGAVTITPVLAPAIYIARNNVRVDESAAFDLGEALSGSTSQTLFFISNPGSADLVISSISKSGSNADEFSAAGLTLPLTVAAGNGTYFLVNFRPAAPGQRSAVLRFNTNATPNNDPFSLSVTGTSVAPSPAEIEVVEGAANNLTDGASTVDFGSILRGATITKTFTIRNTGSAYLYLSTLTLNGANPGDFTVSGYENYPLYWKETRTFTVTFSPQAVGNRSAKLSFENADSNENPFDINLIGAGSTPEIDVQVPSGTSLADGKGAIAFGVTPAGTPVGKVVTIRNTGGDVLNLGAATIDGAAAGDFTIGAYGSATVPPNGTTVFTLTFKATTAGVRTAALHIPNDDLDENPYDLNLTATCDGPEISIENAAGAALASGAAMLDFGTLTVGANASQVITVKNLGTKALTGFTTSFTLAGFSTSHLIPAAGIAANGKNTMTVRFQPTTVGPFSGSLRILTNDYDENPFTIQVKGEAVPTPPEIAVEQPAGTSLTSNAITPIDFGTTVTGAGTPVVRTFTVRNLGGTALTGVAATIDGANASDFTVTKAPGATLSGGGNTTVEVRFTPSADSARTANLKIASNDADENPFVILLTGTGTTFVDANFVTSGDVPITSDDFTATGKTLNLTLNHVPRQGTTLTVVQSRLNKLIKGEFVNLPQGQLVRLTYGGNEYKFIADYYGGSGNDLVLRWAESRLMAWGQGHNGRLGTGSPLVWTRDPLPVAVNGALAGKSILHVAVGAAHVLALCSDGSLAAWGSDQYGQLGDGKTLDQTTAILVPVAGTPLAGKRIIGIAAGDDFSAALCSDGTLATWGSNSAGQLGDGSNTSRATPGLIKTAGTALAGKLPTTICAGGQHMLVICDDNTLVAWGANPSGQLGDNSKVNRNAAVAVATDTGLAGQTVVAVAGGAAHSLALTSTGFVVAWGANGYAQGGVAGAYASGSNSILKPGRVMYSNGADYSHLANKTVTAIRAGGDFSGAICSDGTLALWGGNQVNQIGLPNPAPSISVIQTASRVNGAGAFGNKKATAVGFGNEHTLAVNEDGTLLTWGNANWGQTGPAGTGYTLPAPTALTSGLGAGEYYFDVFSGPNSNFSFAMAAIPPVIPPTSKFQVFNGDSLAFADLRVSNTNTRDFGSAEIGITGESRTFTLHNAGSAAMTVTSATMTGAAAADYTIAGFTPSSVILPGGKIVITATFKPTTFGIRDAALSVVHTGANGPTPYIIPITGRANVFYATGNEVPLNANGAYTATGTINFRLGFDPQPGTELRVINKDGRDFIQGAFSNLTPGQVVLLDYGSNRYRFIADYNGGDGNDLVLVWADTRLMAWGRSYTGAAGYSRTATYTDDYPEARNVVVGGTVLDGKTVVRVATGRHTLAVCPDGTVAGWGPNDYGQLGNGTSGNLSYVPTTTVLTGALAGKRVVQVAVGNYHSLAVTSDGRVYSWGGNWSGELGDGTTSLRSAPVAVVTANTPMNNKRIIAVAAAEYRSFALSDDGLVFGWGADYGVLGQGDNNSYAPVPVQITFPNNAIIQRIAACSNRALAADINDNCYVWGAKLVGDGTSGRVSRPAMINVGGPVIGLDASASIGGVLTGTGGLFTWGINDRGQVGVYPVNYGYEIGSPTSLSNQGALSSRTAIRMSLGGAASLIECSDGALLKFGGNWLTNDHEPKLINPHTNLQPGERRVRSFTGGEAEHYFSFIAYPPSAEIAVEQPVGYDLADGGSTVDFGKVELGSSTTRVFTVRSAGLIPLTGITASISGTNADEFTIVGTVPDSIPVGQSASITVRFAPTVLSSRSAQLLITSNDPDEASFHINLMGTAPFPILSVSSQSKYVGGNGTVDYGITQIGTQKDLSFAFNSVGSSGLENVNAVVDGANASDFQILTPLPGKIAAGSAFTTGIRFKPGALGVRTATLRITSNSNGQTVYVINLTGNGYGLSFLATSGGAMKPAFSPASATYYQAVPASTATLNVWPNLYDSNARVQVRVNGDEWRSVNPFRLVAGTLTRGFVVKADGTIRYSGASNWGSTWMPSSINNIIGVAGGGGTRSAALRNNGDVVAWDGGGGNGATKIVSLGGSGAYCYLNQNGSVEDYTFGGPASTAGVSVACAGALNNLFSMAVKYDGSVSVWGDWSFCNSNGLLNIPNDAKSGVIAVTTTATACVALRADGRVVAWGTGAETVVPAGGQSGVVAIAGGYHHVLALKGDGSVIGWGYNESGQISIPGNATFGVSAIAAGMNQSFALRTNGATVGWGDPEGAALVAYFNSITPATIQPTAPPAAANLPLMPGNNLVEVRITTLAGASYVYSINVNRSDSVPDIAIEQPPAVRRLLRENASVEFGTQNVGKNITLPIRMRNAGTGTINNIAASIIGDNPADFTFSAAPPATLAVGADTTLTVKFAPLASGPRTAILRIASNDPDESPFDVVLTGAGVAPQNIAIEQPEGVLLSPASATPVDFGNVIMDGSADLAFALRDLGDLPLTNIAAKISGANASAFKVLTAPAATLNSGENTTLVIRFTPGGTGTRNATLEVASNDPDTPKFTISLTGTGVAGPDLAVLDGKNNLTNGVGNLVIGPVTVGSTVTRDITLKNVGAGPLSDLSVNIVNGISFRVSQPLRSTLNDGVSTTFRITYFGTSPGTDSDQIEILSNDPNETSFIINVTANTPDVLAPVAILPPAHQFANVGDSVTFSASFATSNLTTYQWYRGATVINGATGTEFTLNNVTLADANAYTVKATNPKGSTTSAPAQLVVLDPVAAVRTIAVGTTGKLTAPVAGAVLTYKWKKNGGNLTEGAKYKDTAKATLQIMNLADPGDEGAYTCEVTAAPGVRTTAVIQLGVAIKPVVNAFTLGDGRMGESYDSAAAISAANVPTAYAITGLPAGLTYNALSGAITGRPTASGNFTIKVIASNSAGASAAVQGSLKILDLPNGAAGTFTGTIAGDSATLGGLLTLTTTGTGAYSGAAVIGVNSYSFTGGLPPLSGNGTQYAASATATTSNKLTIPISFTLTPGSRSLTATIGGAQSVAVLATAVPVSYQGNYTLAMKLAAGSGSFTSLPQGASFGTLTVSNKGVGAAILKLADDTSVTASGPVGEGGYISIFSLLYKNTGSLFGYYQIDTANARRLNGSVMTWVKGPQAAATRSFAMGFGPLSLDTIGRPYSAPNTGVNAFGANGTSNASLTFTGGLLTAGRIDWTSFMLGAGSPSVITPPGSNPGLVSLSVTPGSGTAFTAGTTGTFKGAFALTDDNTSVSPVVPLTRKVTFQGILADDGTGLSGYGYFSLPEMPSSGPPATTDKTSPVWSGAVRLQKLQ